MEVARRTARNIVYRTLAQIVANISGLLFSIYLARALGVDEFGIYTLAMSVGMIAISVSNLGIDATISRYTSYLISKKESYKIGVYLRYLLKMKLVMAGVTFAIILMLSEHLALFFRNDALKLPFILVGFLVITTSLSSSLNSFFSGLQRFEFVFLRQTSHEVSRWAIVFALAGSLSAADGIFANTAGRLAGFMTLFAVLLSRYRSYFYKGEAEVEKEVASYAKKISVSQLGQRIYTYIDAVMIGALLATSYVGIYRAAANIVFVAASMLALNEVFLPLFAQLEGKDMENAFKRITKYITAFSFPVVVAGVFFSDKIVVVLYSSDYLPASTPFAILSIAMVFMVYNYFTAILNAKGYPDVTAKIVMTSILINVLLNYFLIIEAGIAGAALATLISRGYTVLISARYLSSKLNLRPDVPTIVKAGVSSSVMYLVLLALPEPETILEGVAVLSAGFIAYLATIMLTKGIRKEDIEYVLSVTGIRV